MEKEEEMDDFLAVMEEMTSEAPPADKQSQSQLNDSDEVDDVPNMQDQTKPIEGGGLMTAPLQPSHR